MGLRGGGLPIESAGRIAWERKPEGMALWEHFGDRIGTLTYDLFIVVETRS